MSPPIVNRARVGRFALGAAALFLACLAWTRVGEESPGSPRQQPREHAGQRSTSSALRVNSVAEEKGRGSEPGFASPSGLTAAVSTLTSTRQLLADGSPAGAAREPLAHIAIDHADGTDDALERLYARAFAGDQDALAAYLTMAAHQASFVSRSQEILHANAARGSVLALTELATRATVGYGFERADIATAIFYEYLAWRTGRWMPPTDSAIAFVPTIGKHGSVAEFERATSAGDAFLSASPQFPRAD